MLTKITQIGTSVGVIIPKFIANECGYKKGSEINLEYKDGKIIISKPKQVREGWADAFKKYANEMKFE